MAKVVQGEFPKKEFFECEIGAAGPFRIEPRERVIRTRPD